MSACPCQSGKEFDLCCGPYLEGAALPETAEQLMRSRYTAYVRRDVGYLKATLWPKFQKSLDLKGLKEWAETKHWTGLEILRTAKGGADHKIGMVLFVARSLEAGKLREHREFSLFKKKKGRWYYVEARPEADVMGSLPDGLGSGDADLS